jgi:hypothetical protein
MEMKAFPYRTTLRLNQERQWRLTQKAKQWDVLCSVSQRLESQVMRPPGQETQALEFPELVPQSWPVIYKLPGS